jgi:hypothetical protein
VVDLFKIYTFYFWHIVIRAIVWQKILFFSELLELLQNLQTGPHLLPPASPSLFLCSAAHRPSPAFSLATSYPFATLPVPPGPQLARPPLNRPRWLILARTRHAACRPSRHARHQPPAAACRPLAGLFLAWEFDQ